MKGITTAAAHAVTPGGAATMERVLRRGRAPRVLVLTSGLGSGHVRAAEAIGHALRRLQPDVQTHQLDFWSLMNPGVAATIKEKYLELVLDNPDLYARLHRLDERTWRRVMENDIPPPAEVVELIELLTRNEDAGRRSAASLFERALGQYASDLLFWPTACAAMPTSSSERAGNNVSLLRLALLKWAFMRLQGRMEHQLLKHAPDVVVATQMVPAALVSALKQGSRRWARLPLVGVLTDFGAHDYWAQPGIDLYCVPHESLAGPPLVAGGVADAARIEVTGAPLMPSFERLPTRAGARRRIGLDVPEGVPVILLLGGGLGLGLDTLAEPLLDGLPGCTVVVMAGRNADVGCRLAALQTRVGGRLRVVGWTEHVEQFLAAADLVVGKPGGLTVAEVLACGRPLLVTHSLQGQESFNVQFLERHGVGVFVREDELPATAARCLADPAALQEWCERSHLVGRRDGAVRVASRALELAGVDSRAQRRTGSGE